MTMKLYLRISILIMLVAHQLFVTPAFAQQAIVVDDQNTGFSKGGSYWGHRMKTGEIYAKRKGLLYPILMLFLRSPSQLPISAFSALVAVSS
jgi:hypothetical protein